MGKGVRVRNTTVNGGMTGRDTEINKVFAHKSGTSFSTMKKFSQANQPNSPEQQAVRDALAQSSAGWSALIQDKRDAWNAEAPNWVNTGVFGDKSQSGKNLYSGANIALASADMNPLAAPGQKAMVAVIESAEFLKVGNALKLQSIITIGSVNNVLQVLVSKRSSAGTSKNDKKVILFNANLEADISEDVTGLYVAKYGQPLANEKIFYTLRTVSQGGATTIYSKGHIVF